MGGPLHNVDRGSVVRKVGYFLIVGGSVGRGVLLRGGAPDQDPGVVRGGGEEGGVFGVRPRERPDCAVVPVFWGGGILVGGLVGRGVWGGVTLVGFLVIGGFRLRLRRF